MYSAGQNGNPSFDRVVASTFVHLQKEMADNISDNIPFMKYMKMKGKMMADGGEKIVRRLMYGFANAQSYAGSDTFDVSKQEGISAAEYNWKQAVVPVVIEGIEKARNSGRAKQVDLISDVKEQAVLSMSNFVAEMMFGDGTGNGGKDILGLEALVDLDPTTGVLGGINRATNTWWRNYVNAAVGAYITNLFRETSTAIRSTTRGMDKIDLLIAGNTVFGYYEDLAFGKAQYLNPALADLGFRALKFQGIDLIHDDKCPEGRVYGVNTKYMKYYVHQDVNYVMGKFIEPANQDVMVAKYKVYHQLTTNRAESAFVLSGITAS